MHSLCPRYINIIVAVFLLLMTIAQVSAADDSDSDLGFFGHFVGFISSLPGHVLTILGTIFMNLVYSLTGVTWILPKATIFMNFITDRTVRLYFNFFIVVMGAFHCWGRLAYVIYYFIRQLLFSAWFIFSNEDAVELFTPPPKFKQFRGIQELVRLGNPDDASDPGSTPLDV